MLHGLASYEIGADKDGGGQESPDTVVTNHLPHDGRHTCATLMYNADVPKKIKQLILGHSSQEITGKVYTHKTLAQLIEAINRI